MQRRDRRGRFASGSAPFCGIFKGMSHRALGGQFMWHVSDHRNRDSIAEQGLAVDASQDRRHVWLYPTRERADLHVDLHNSGGASMDGTKPKADLYQVDVTGMRTAKDPHGEHFGGRVVKKTVEPARIKRLT